MILINNECNNTGVLLYNCVVLFFKKCIELGLAKKYAFYPIVSSIIGVLLTKYVVPRDILRSYLGLTSFRKIPFNIFKFKWHLLVSLLQKEINIIPAIIFILFYVSVGCLLFVN